MTNLKIIIFAVIFVHISLNLYGQTYNKVITDNQYSNFFDELRKNKNLDIDKVNQKIISWKRSDIYGIDDTTYFIGHTFGRGVLENDSVQKYFSKNDMVFIEEQFEKINDSLWQEKDFKSFNLIDTSGIRKIHEYSMRKMRIKRNNYAYSFSMPIYSLDRNFVIIQIDYYCGFMCSEQCIHIYQRKPDGKSWKEVTKWGCWAT